jgi:ribosomal protein S28E/S33
VNEITIFDGPMEGNFVRRESRYKDRMGNSGGSTMRRIKLSNGRDFTRVINGEVIGTPVEKQLDVIIVGWLDEPSRKFYAGKYDSTAKGVTPDCWSNHGVKPEANSKNPQARSCMECPQNVKGSGEGDRKACRYERRIAVLVVGDPTGTVYQMSIPAASLFSTNEGNMYGFQGYRKFLMANNEAFDGVVTSIIYDRKVQTTKVFFKATSFLNPQQVKLVDQAQDNPDTERYTMLSTATVDAPKAIAAAPEPVAAIAAAPAVAPSNPFGDDEDEIEEAPVKRATKKETPAAPKAELNEVLGDWLDDDEG